jgi:hypothetical protein
MSVVELVAKELRVMATNVRSTLRRYESNDLLAARIDELAEKLELNERTRT